MVNHAGAMTQPHVAMGGTERARGPPSNVGRWAFHQVVVVPGCPVWCPDPQPCETSCLHRLTSAFFASLPD